MVGAAAAVPAAVRGGVWQPEGEEGRSGAPSDRAARLAAVESMVSMGGTAASAAALPLAVRRHLLMLVLRRTRESWPPIVAGARGQDGHQPRQVAGARRDGAAGARGAVAAATGPPPGG